MAVYTHLDDQDLAAIIAAYDVGTLVSAKGIAEGVSNSNWLIQTTGVHGVATHFILTMYEFRIDIAELPYFLSLVDHLAAHGCPVPRTIHDRTGALYRTIGDKAVALFEFLPGVSVGRPTPGQAHATGGALARLHLASADFAPTRANGMGPDEWLRLAALCSDTGMAAIDHDLAAITRDNLPRIVADWPTCLPRSVIHADLFPDNTLVLGDTITGLIDFYFACNDTTAYDLAVAHLAWCWDDRDGTFRDDVSRALIAGYTAVRPLSPTERDALPVLAQGAAIRFMLSRAYDWINTPADALVTRKDPMPMARRMLFYRDNHACFGPEVFDSASFSGKPA